MTVNNREQLQNTEHNAVDFMKHGMMYFTKLSSLFHSKMVYSKARFPSNISISDTLHDEIF